SPPKLRDPPPPYPQGCIFAADGAQMIGVPRGSNGQRAQRLGLFLALWTFENEHVIDLLTGIIDTRNRRNQIARPNGVNVRRIIGVEIVDQPRIEARYTVPSQRLEVVAHRMKFIFPRYCL